MPQSEAFDVLQILVLLDENLLYGKWFENFTITNENFLFSKWKNRHFKNLKSNHPMIDQSLFFFFPHKV